uniref:Uncharacterized protein n=1 Tax=Microplitis mediator bracovirus TaxID=1836595 RepID=A0A1D5APJ0_9VIRU|nr:hypothetical protein A6F54_64 [Microplitis mediator bracovirus]
MLYEDEDSAYAEIDESESDDEIYELIGSEDPDDAWLTANDPIFWCLAPAHLEEVAWLFRAAPTRQPRDSMQNPLTLLEYYILMDVDELLDRLWLAPKRVHDALCMMWVRVKNRRNLATKNSILHSLGPELDFLFDQDPA